ncbi:MAG: ATP-dependent DNA ligase [Acidimicrobiia bacterium]
MLLADLVNVSASVSATRARSKKTELLAGLLARLSQVEARAAVSYLSGRPLQSPLGVGYASVGAVDVEPALSPSLEILDVDRTLEKISGAGGPGSNATKRELLDNLFSRATADEQRFLRGLLLRNLRQGALEGVMADAVALALGVPPAKVRRAAMVRGNLIGVAADALAEGPDSLEVPSLELMTPVQPMLAKTATTAAEAVAGLGSAVVERKLDGLRLQVHRDGDQVAVFTRNLRDVTSDMPGVVSAAMELDVDSVILDGEGLLIDASGSPLSFQDSMSGMAEASGLDLVGFFFDILHLDGTDLVDEPLRTRRRALVSAIPEQSRVGSIITGDPEEAEAFFAESVSAGFEGVVVKDPARPYEAGRRGSGWLKVKPTHTLDLVILAAEWGSGRRQGWLSNLHLGARDPAGGFVMLGKTFKGLTDQMLEWQTARFLQNERDRTGHIVFLEPEIVYEIAFDGVQRSTRYPGGVALRFARVKRYRDDKTPEDADTIDEVRRHLR